MQVAKLELDGRCRRGLVIIRCHGTVGHSVRSCFVSEPLPLGVVALVEFVRSLPYGRPSRRTSACMLAERKGTCSTKHAFLYDVIEERYPELEPRLVHRVYRVTRAAALATYGEAAAATVPADGLVDVHRYLELAPARERIRVDATFAGLPWDGASSMELACGPGEDHPVTGDRDAEKRALEARFCDPAVREPFIAALAARHPRR